MTTTPIPLRHTPDPMSAGAGRRGACSVRGDVREGAVSLAAPRIRHHPAGDDRADARRASRRGWSAASSRPAGSHRLHRRWPLRTAPAPNAWRLHGTAPGVAGRRRPPLRRRTTAAADCRRPSPRRRPVRRAGCGGGVCRGSEGRRGDAALRVLPVAEDARQWTCAWVWLSAAAGAVRRDGAAGGCNRGRNR